MLMWAQMILKKVLTTGWSFKTVFREFFHTEPEMQKKQIINGDFENVFFETLKILSYIFLRSQGLLITTEKRQKEMKYCRANGY